MLEIVRVIPVFIFFFQAEDGIRDTSVTGVQTCALPIYNIVSVTFSVTRDLDAIFPAAIARRRPRWDSVPLLDVQQMHVEGSLPRCIRLMLYVYLPTHVADVNHTYLRGAQKLRPDLCLATDA